MEKEVIIAIIGALAVVGGAVISSGILNPFFIDDGGHELPVITSLDSDPKNYGENGTTIRWTATADDPDSRRLLYKFSVKNVSTDEQWTVGRTWGTQRAWEWIPTKTGKYLVQAEVRDEDHAGTEGRDDNWTVPYEIVEKADSKAKTSEEPLVTKGPEPDKPSPQVASADIKSNATTEKEAKKVVPAFFSEEDPAVAASSWGEGRLDLFVIGTDGALYHRYGGGSSWSVWERLDGEWVSAPAAVSWGPDRIDVFAVGSDTALWHIWGDGSTWGDWESLGGDWTSAPAVSSPGENVLDVFIRGEDNALWHIRWDGPRSKWGSWESFGGHLTSAPAAVYSGSSRTDIFAKGPGNTLVHKWWDVPRWTWSDWESLGGILTSAPTVSSPDENVLDVYIRGEDNALYMNRWDGRQSKWGGWQTLDGKLTSAPAAIYSGSYRTDIFARGTNNTLVHKWWDVPKWAWSGFETIGEWP